MLTISRLIALLIFAVLMLYAVEWWITRPPPPDYSAQGLLAEHIARPPPYAFEFKCGTGETKDCYTYSNEIWPR